MLKIIVAKFLRCRSLSLILILIPTTVVQADNESLWQMSLAELVKVPVTSLASGTATPLDKAASVITVITEAEILAMGATDIDQVLETVPGLHVSPIASAAFSPNYVFRGITSTFTPQTLLLINGIPVTSLFVGSRSNVWGGMPVKAIKKIEVIRGPGSALYGADAFSGVINVITKTGQDMAGTKSGVRAGSFDTRATWIEHGANYGGYDVGVAVEYQSTDGWKEEIEVDGVGGSGPVSTGVKSTELRLDIAKNNWILRAGYQGRRDLGLGAGIAQVLDPLSKAKSDRVNVDTTYRLENAREDLDIEGQLSYYYNSQGFSVNPTLFPSGVFPGFPDGVIGAPTYKEQHLRARVSALYRGIDQHLIRFGVGAFWGDIFETSEPKNFNFDPATSPPITPKGRLVDVADTDEVFLPEKDRKNSHVFVQDEWQFDPRWALTTGLRFDHYSDFGNTTNPRVALVWSTTDSITTKLLYGRAFRAPAFVELFATSNPVSLGNEDLKPETIDSYELALSHQLSPDLLYRANIFSYKIKDFIEYVATVAQNTGNRSGKGIELEADYSPTPSSRIVANYAFQKSVDDDSHHIVGGAPNHQFYLRAEWRTEQNWTISPQLNWVGKQPRGAGDTRESTPHYTTIDLTFRQHDLFPNMDTALSIRNFFDRDVFEPSPNGVPAPAIPNDFPMAGRSIYAEVAYRF